MPPAIKPELYIAYYDFQKQNKEIVNDAVNRLQDSARVIALNIGSDMIHINESIQTDKAGSATY